MLNATVKKEIVNQIKRLDYEHQRRVLEFARVLAVTSPKGVPGKQLLSFAGAIHTDDLKTIKQAIEDNCEMVTLNEWIDAVLAPPAETPAATTTKKATCGK